jgi:AraC family transcriptional regulator
MTEANDKRALPRAKSQRREITLRELRRHIDANLDGDLSLATLARRAEMSTSRFSHWFREQMGTTPHAFVVNARLERAKELLRSSESPLIEIAFAVGFSSQSCLNVTFCRRAGMTPTQYRAQFSRKAKDTARRDVQSSRSRAPAARPSKTRRGQSR